MSVYAEVLPWPHHPEVSLGQECQIGFVYVPFVYKHSGAAWGPGLKVVRQVVPGSHYKECCAELAMFAMTTPTAQVCNGDTRQTGYMPAIAQLWKGQGIHSILALGGYSPWTGGCGGSLKATKTTSGFPRTWMEQHSPKLEGAGKGSPCRSAHSSSFSSEVHFIQTKIAGWIANRVRCNLGIKNTLPRHLHRNNLNLWINSQ